MNRENISYFLSLATLLSHILIFLWASAILFIPNHKFTKLLNKFIGIHGLKIAFATACVATLMSLGLSVILNFPACSLCWWQRIFLFPQVVILGVSLYKKDDHGLDSALILNFLGAIIAIYNYYIQMGGSSLFSCETNGSVSCSIRLIYEFGYITIPLMSLTIFAYTTIFLLYRKNYLKKNF